MKNEKTEQRYIIINEKIKTPGTVTIKISSSIEKDESYIDRQIIRITGSIETKYYEPVIDSIKTERFFITGITVVSEKLNSESDEIIYDFTAENIDILYQSEDFELITGE